VSRPGRPQAGPSDAGKPQIYDTAPPSWTGVPPERDPVSGRLLAGDPLGRRDKGRRSHTPARAALITAAAVAGVAAVVVAVVLVTGRDDPAPDLTAAAGAATSEQSPSDQSPSDQTPSEQTPSEQTLSEGTTTEQTTSAAPTTSPPAVETGPRDVPVNLIQTAITPPPGFGPDPTYGTVGEVRPRLWTITGACNGSGPCDVQHCQAPGQCTVSFTGKPEGKGYVARFTSPVQWGSPTCSGGSIDNTITWAISGEGDAVRITGSWVEQSAQVVFTGSDGGQCGLYLAEFEIASP
jgi:hypothetical protein